MSASTERYLVLGGAGFLGSHITSTLAAQGRDVSVFDLVEPVDENRIENVSYFQGDITDEERLLDVLKQTSATTVFHTTSPNHTLPWAVHFRVNVLGTRTVISACQASKVRVLVYTSSTGTVWNNVQLNGVTEAEAKIPAKGYDGYHHTKPMAEKLVLAANHLDGMRTVALRPCGIFGPGDAIMYRFARVYAEGRQNIQIGNNTAMTEFVYVDNLVDAHLRAANLLLPDSPKADQVAGEAFFITNGEPMPPWTFYRMIWKEFGDDRSKPLIIIPRPIALFMALIAELWCRITGGTTDFTVYSVRYVTCNAWHNIDKARTILGYEPRICIEEGIRRSVKWWNEKGSVAHSQLTAKTK